MSRLDFLRRFLRRIPEPSPDDLDSFLTKLRGVIHVGANAGQESWEYEKLLLDVIWIEPQPLIFKKLEANTSHFPRQRAFQRLIADRDGVEHVFHVANNDGLSSSILDLKDHRDIWPQVDYEDAMTLEAVTLDTLLANERIDQRKFDGLVLDTQGSELLVLKGAMRLLRSIRWIKTEAADFEAYAGGCSIADLDSFLRPLGFTEFTRKSFAKREGGGECFDVVFRRRGRMF